MGLASIDRQKSQPCPVHAVLELWRLKWPSKELQTLSVAKRKKSPQRHQQAAARQEKEVNGPVELPKRRCREKVTF